MKPHRSILAALALFASVPSHSDAMDDWLTKHARAVRTLDSTDEDFSDLEPLGAAIGSARVVMLGEPSHGSGSAFAAKVRLVKFLHRKMSFDVVAWESGMFDVRGAQVALQASPDPTQSAALGILPVWSKAAEVQPLFAYAKEKNGTPRPLELAGFDINASAPKFDERFAEALKEFIQDVGDPAFQKSWTTLADDALATLARIKSRDSKPVAADLARLERAIGKLRAHLSANRDTLGRYHSPLRIGIYDHILANALASSTNTYHRRCCEPPTGDDAARLQSEEWNRRDEMMAANLLWLLDEAFRGRKIVVWAHNAHLLRQHFSADWKGVHAKPQPFGMTPMGASLAKTLRDSVYSIAFTTYEGEEAWTNGQKRGSIAPAPAGSFEARLHALGKRNLFVDLRAARNDSARPLGTPTTLRISGFGEPSGRYGNDAVSDLARAFDGVFFIDRMAPATQLAE